MFEFWKARITLQLSSKHIPSVDGYFLAFLEIHLSGILLSLRIHPFM